MRNVTYLQTLCLNSDDYKPLVHSGKLVAKRKPDAGSTEQQPPEKKAKAPVFTPAPFRSNFSA